MIKRYWINFFILKDKEDFEAAFEILEPLSKKYLQNFEIFFLLGSVLYQSANFKKAVEYLQEAIALKPSHSLSSLCLIQTLGELNKWHTAFEEMRRFLLTDSKNKEEHILLLRELADEIDNFDTSERATIKKLQNHFHH
ncbi:MAG: tetratricopeptide repeat protein [Ferruginibacter sp.]